MRQFLFAAAAALLLTPADGRAHDYQHGALKIEHPHARLVIPSRPAAAYLTIQNSGAADRLVSVETDAFARAELHTHEAADGVVRMRRVEAIEIPEGGAAALVTGGDHVMLFDAATPLKAGDSFPMTLRFEKAGPVEIEVKIEPLAASGGAKASHESHAADHGGHAGHAMDHGDHGAAAPKTAQDHRSHGRDHGGDHGGDHAHH